MAKEGEYRAPKASTHPVHSSTFLAFEESGAVSRKGRTCHLSFACSKGVNLGQERLQRWVWGRMVKM